MELVGRTPEIAALEGCLASAPGPFTITKAVTEDLRRKRAMFAAETGTRKAIHVTLVTPFGVQRNQYSAEIDSEVTGADLFAPQLANWR